MLFLWIWLNLFAGKLETMKATVQRCPSLLVKPCTGRRPLEKLNLTIECHYQSDWFNLFGKERPSRTRQSAAGHFGSISLTFLFFLFHSFRSDLTYSSTGAHRRAHRRTPRVTAVWDRLIGSAYTDFKLEPQTYWVRTISLQNLALESPIPVTTAIRPERDLQLNAAHTFSFASEHGAIKRTTPTEFAQSFFFF